MRLPFSVTPSAEDTAARSGVVDLGHTRVETPQFMPVGTQATVRAQRTTDLAPGGATMLLANAWHLAQQPGTDVVAAMGGLRRFMGWEGGILTDSGGYQVFSLGAVVDEDGVDLRHPTSGRALRLTPTTSVHAQVALGADIGMVLDHCVPSTAPWDVARDAMLRTHRWAQASLDARGDARMALFGIVQGACHRDLRVESAQRLTELPFDGFAIGGLAVGESKVERETFTGVVTAHLPVDRPRYLMGVGTPLDLLEAVHRGVDLFDCILPTAMAQRGRAYTRLGRIELRRAVYRLQDAPLDPDCRCDACQRYSRAYLRHLYVAREPLAWTLIGLHNLTFWLDLMGRIRESLREGGFLGLYQAEREVLDAPDLDHPPSPTPPKRRRTPATSIGRWTLHHAPAFGDQPPFVAIKDNVSGEVMHAVTAPDAEARRLYVDQPGLPALAEADGPPLVVWDVGLGAATNAMEVIRCWEACSRGRELQLISFERDLDALRLALLHDGHFPRLRHAAPHAVLADGSWSRGRVRWTLLEGDFLATCAAAPVPDLVLYDPFSFKVDAPLWQPSVFRRLVAGWGDHPVRLYTYSNSTAVRAAMLAGGLYVGPGVGTGPKTETTVAWTRPEPRDNLLSPAFLDKWRRSSAAWPPEVTDREVFAGLILDHPQWRR